MAKFIIQPHGRLQEWIAHEKNYFRDEGLDYDFLPGPSADSRKASAPTGVVADILSGAFESYRAAGGNKGTRSDISCACHWTVNEAAAEGIGLLWDESYVVTPGAIMVAPESPIALPEDLAGKEIAVGYHSGSHFTALQALEVFLPPERIRLKFTGSSWGRVDVALDRDLPAVSAWGLTFLFLEQLGFRKIVDTSFMIAFMFPEGTDAQDVRRYMNALRRAQQDLDVAPEAYKHFYTREIPERYRAAVDVRRFSPGERIVFLPYTKEIFARTQDWLRARSLFAAAE